MLAVGWLGLYKGKRGYRGYTGVILGLFWGYRGYKGYIGLKVWGFWVWSSTLGVEGWITDCKFMALRFVPFSLAPNTLPATNMETPKRPYEYYSPSKKGLYGFSR